MLKQFRDKKSPSLENIKIIATPTISKIIIPNGTSSIQIILLDENKFVQLKNYFSSLISELDERSRYLEELITTQKRTKDLKETKEIVFSLREIEFTSQDAMDFLKEKIDSLQKEKDNLKLAFSQLRVELLKSPLTELTALIQKCINQISLVDTNSWEEKLDYLRTRFLMQQEQENIDKKMKMKFIPEEEKKSYLEIKKEENNKSKISSKTYLILALTKQQSQELLPLIKQYTILSDKTPNDLFNDVLETPNAELKDKLALQEKISNEIGQELYTLKREQGILSLKTYEIIQTLKSRLINISGFIAERKFLSDSIIELLNQSQNENNSNQSRKDTLLQTLQNLLRILG